MSMLQALKVVFCLTFPFATTTAEVADPESPPPVHQNSRSVSAKVGQNVTLECFYYGKISRVYWFKQTLGEKPTLVTSFYRYNHQVSFHGEFQKNSRFTSSSGNGTHRLTISDLQRFDSATYYCATSSFSIPEFTGETTVLVQGSGQSLPVWVDQWASGSVQSCGSVTLQCRIVTGIYHCAVASCGLLFGNGTKLDFESEGRSPALLTFLGSALAFTSVLSLSLASSLYVLRRRKRREWAEPEHVCSNVN